MAVTEDADNPSWRRFSKISKLMETYNFRGKRKKEKKAAKKEKSLGLEKVYLQPGLTGEVTQELRTRKKPARGGKKGRRVLKVKKKKVRDRGGQSVTLQVSANQEEDDTWAPFFPESRVTCSQKKERREVELKS